MRRRSNYDQLHDQLQMRFGITINDYIRLYYTYGLDWNVLSYNGVSVRKFGEQLQIADVE